MPELMLLHMWANGRRIILGRDRIMTTGNGGLSVLASLRLVLESQRKEKKMHAGEMVPGYVVWIAGTLVITTLACFSEGEPAVRRISPGLSTDCTMARHSPLKAFLRFDL